MCSLQWRNRERLQLFSQRNSKKDTKVFELNSITFDYGKTLIYLFHHSRVPSKDSSPDTTKQQINSSQAEMGKC